MALIVIPTVVVNDSEVGDMTKILTMIKVVRLKETNQSVLVLHAF